MVAGNHVNEYRAEPTSDSTIDYLSSLRKECGWLDFKLTIHVGKKDPFSKLAKHLLGFANFGGGWLLVGWKEDDTRTKYLPVGIPNDYCVDSAQLQDKLNAYSSEDLVLDVRPYTRTVEGQDRTFIIVHIPPSKTLIKAKKDGKFFVGEKKSYSFRKGDILYRRGSKTVVASTLERQAIEQRVKEENYQHTVLSGEPDNIQEKLSSNLFEVTHLPEHVYLGEKKDLDYASMKALLKEKGVFPEWILKFREHEGNLVFFENIEDQKSPYRELVNIAAIRRERIEGWLSNPDKRRIIVSLLYKEFVHHCFSKGLWHSYKNKDRFFFSCESDHDERTERWNSRLGGNRPRQVAKKTYASQLQKTVYFHHSFSPGFIELHGKKFYLRINPSFIITENGKDLISNFESGTFITRLQHKQYNSQYLNNILFWIDKLKNGKDICVAPYFRISALPLSVYVNKGILTDIPVTEIKKKIEKQEEEAHVPAR